MTPVGAGCFILCARGVSSVTFEYGSFSLLLDDGILPLPCAPLLTVVPSIDCLGLYSGVGPSFPFGADIVVLVRGWSRGCIGSGEKWAVLVCCTVDGW